jgi:hypothetical protein
MKKTILTLLLTLQALTANSSSENVASLEPKISQQPVSSTGNKATIGHVTFKAGPGLFLDTSNLFPVLGVGYQSRIIDSLVFQSKMIEFSGMWGEKKTKNSDFSSHEIQNIVYFPKMMGLHYFNTQSDNRLFAGIGTNISYSIDTKWVTNLKSQTENSYRDNELTSFGGSFALGLEMGKPSESVSIIKLEFDQPLIDIYKEGDPSHKGNIALSYVIGF